MAPDSGQCCAIGSYAYRKLPRCCVAAETEGSVATAARSARVTIQLGAKTVRTNQPVRLTVPQRDSKTETATVTEVARLQASAKQEASHASGDVTMDTEIQCEPTGFVLWPVAVHLADFMHQRYGARWRREYLGRDAAAPAGGVRLVELGAGLGATGMTAALFRGSGETGEHSTVFNEVILTDCYPASMEIALAESEAIVADKKQNFKADLSHVSARQLWWGEMADNDRLKGQVDVVIASDVIFNQEREVIEKLVLTVKCLLRPAAVNPRAHCLLAAELRSEASWEQLAEFQDLCEEHGMQVECEKMDLADGEEPREGDAEFYLYTVRRCSS